MAIAMAAIMHAFEEYCGGGGGGSADFVALEAPYVFAFHLAMGVRLVGSVPSRFGAGGGGRGGPSGSGPMVREATMVAARTDGGGSGGGVNNGEDNGAALSAVPSLPRARTSWQWGGRWCLGILSRPLLIGVMMSRQ